MLFTDIRQIVYCSERMNYPIERVPAFCLFCKHGPSSQTSESCMEEIGANTHKTIERAVCFESNSWGRIEISE